MKTILFLAANPINTSHLRLDQEFRDIKEGLNLSKKRDEFSLKQCWAVRPRDLQQAILETNPQIVHISGHGIKSEGLMLEDEIGQPKIIKGEALANLFRIFSDVVECVILNSCHSNLYAEMINQYVPYVIGMRQSIGDRAAIQFSSGFYCALGEGKSIPFAYEFGCISIQVEGLLDYQTPKLNENKKLSKNDVSRPSTGNKTGNQNPVEVFVSYDNNDKDLFSIFEPHLDVLNQEGTIRFWDQSKILPGSIRHDEINKHLESARIILLLISSSFLSSTSQCKPEFERAIEKHRAKEVTIIPIYLKYVSWPTQISELEPVPSRTKPVSKWPNRDEAFIKVIQGMLQVIGHLEK